jgi:hypothetical protein
LQLEQPSLSLQYKDDIFLKSAALKKQMNLEVIPTPTDVEEFNAASTGWTGVQIPTEKKTLCSRR